MALLLKHQTVAQFVSRFREAWRDAYPERRVALAKFLVARIQAADITDAQCRTVFGLNATQWNAVKTKMNNLIAADTTIKTATGD